MNLWNKKFDVSGRMVDYCYCLGLIVYDVKIWLGYFIHSID